MEQSSQMNKEIGERIREARQSKNMSQQDLATKANVSLPHIMKMGLPAFLASKSHTALTTAPVARCIAPLSGPIQRNWLSPVR